MESISVHNLLERHQRGELEQIVFDKNQNTLFTQLYDVTPDWVLLEKHSYGLEYFHHAIVEQGLSTHPAFKYIAALDAEGHQLSRPSRSEVFSKQECGLRLIYLMRRMQHLGDDERRVFDERVHDLEEVSLAQRLDVYKQIERVHGHDLSADIEKLFEFYQRHAQYIKWDLHGDNLMQSLDEGTIFVVDPFTVNID